MPRLKMLNSGARNFAVLGALLAPVLDPDLRLFDVFADIDDHQGGQHADQQQAAPADRIIEQSVGGAGEQRAEAPGALQHRAHEAARALRPSFHRQRRAGRPFRAHADAERVRNSNSNQKLGAKPARRLQTENQAIEIINGFLRPIRSASQPEAVAPTSRIHNVKVKTTATSVSGTPKSLEIGTISSRKIGEVESSRGSTRAKRRPRRAIDPWLALSTTRSAVQSLPLST